MKFHSASLVIFTDGPCSHSWQYLLEGTEVSWKAVALQAYSFCSFSCSFSLSVLSYFLCLDVTHLTSLGNWHIICMYVHLFIYFPTMYKIFNLILMSFIRETFSADSCLIYSDFLLNNWVCTALKTHTVLWF